MTKNQLLYHQNKEIERSNRAKEREENRSNIARELETSRANTAKEAETNRHNLETETVARYDMQSKRMDAMAKMTKPILDGLKIASYFI